MANRKFRKMFQMIDFADQKYGKKWGTLDYESTKYRFHLWSYNNGLEDGRYVVMYDDKEYQTYMKKLKKDIKKEYPEMNSWYQDDMEEFHATYKEANEVDMKYYMEAFYFSLRYTEKIVPSLTKIEKEEFEMLSDSIYQLFLKENVSSANVDEKQNHFILEGINRGLDEVFRESFLHHENLYIQYFSGIFVGKAIFDMAELAEHFEQKFWTLHFDSLFPLNYVEFILSIIPICYIEGKENGEILFDYATYLASRIDILMGVYLGEGVFTTAFLTKNTQKELYHRFLSQRQPEGVKDSSFLLDYTELLFELFKDQYQNRLMGQENYEEENKKKILS